MLWWMACKHIRFSLREKLVHGYPEDPKIDDITSRQDAEDYVTDNSWYRAFPDESVDIQDRDWLSAKLDGAYKTHQQELSDGSWKKTYSGKEIFRHLRGWIYDVQAGSAASKDEDFAKSIGEWQFVNDSVPPPLTDLKNVLKTRVGI